MSTPEGQPSAPAPPAAQAQPQHVVILREKKGNGLGVAGFVCGLIAAIAGLIPLLFWISFPLGVLGLVFGGIGWGRARSDPERGGKGLSIAGVILGIIGIGLAIIGIVIINNAFD